MRIQELLREIFTFAGEEHFEEFAGQLRWCKFAVVFASYYYYYYYAPPLMGGGINRCFCLTSDVCLSVAYIGPQSRTEA